MCTIRHDSGTVASHYHAFDQVGPMDRTDHRLVCELGDIRVDGWIPLTLGIDAAVTDDGAEKLKSLLPGCEVISDEPIPAAGMSSRGQARDATRRLKLFCEPDADKQRVYANSVVGLFVDQLAFIANPDHPRRITEHNGLAAVVQACRAVELGTGN